MTSYIWQIFMCPDGISGATQCHMCHHACCSQRHPNCHNAIHQFPPDIGGGGALEGLGPSSTAR